MSAPNWLSVIGRITPLRPLDLDPVLGPADAEGAPLGRVRFAEEAGAAAFQCARADEDLVCFGARVTAETADPVALAMRLAQMAAERDALPIILSHVDTTGLERFGFRVERIGGETDAERAAAETQIRRFWNIVMVI